MLNALLPTLLAVSLLVFTVILFSFLHPENAFAPIFLTLDGIVMLFSDVHFLNAFAPIEVILLLNFTDLSLADFSNAP